jgi:hypothetical protein
MKRVLALLFGLIAVTVLATDTMLSKARNIKLPILQYRDVALKEILNDIQKKSIELDPEGIGVNFLIRLDEAELDRKLTMTVNIPTIERALNLLAATAVLYIRYEPNAIVVEKSERITGEPKK